MTRRAADQLDSLREEFADRVDLHRTVLTTGPPRVRWWTWGGARANAVLTAALDTVDPDLLGETITYGNWQISLRGDATVRAVSGAMRLARERFGEDLAGVVPLVDERAVQRLKFAEMLPPELATATLAERMADHAGAVSVATRPMMHVARER